MSDWVPTEWHPWYEAYRTNRQLLDWLESDASGPFCLPVAPAPRLIEPSDAPAFKPPQVLVLNKRQAYSGPRNYRDRLMNPGINWYVATDQYGRSICSQPREAAL